MDIKPIIQRLLKECEISILEDGSVYLDKDVVFEILDDELDNQKISQELDMSQILDKIQIYFDGLINKDKLEPMLIDFKPVIEKNDVDAIIYFGKEYFQLSKAQRDLIHDIHKLKDRIKELQS